MDIERYPEGFRNINEQKELFGFDLDTLDEIHFTFFSESKILNNIKLLREMFNKIIAISECKNRKIMCCTVKMICFWPEVEGYGSHIYFTDKSISNIIFKVATDNKELYKRAFKDSYERKLFTDLVVNRIIRIIKKESGITLCEKKKNNQKRVLKK